MPCLSNPVLVRATDEGVVVEDLVLLHHRDEKSVELRAVLHGRSITVSLKRRGSRNGGFQEPPQEPLVTGKNKARPTGIHRDEIMVTRIMELRIGAGTRKTSLGIKEDVHQNTWASESDRTLEGH